jgi:hypothetical protein
MKICGQCKHCMVSDKYPTRGQCDQPAPNWADCDCNKGPFLDIARIAESCDYFAPKEDPKCTP